MAYSTRIPAAQRFEGRRVFLPLGVDEEWRPFVPRLLKGTARRIPVADGRIQCIVTSPPYWSQRAYGGSQDEIWGGNSKCRHRWGTETFRKQAPQRDHARGGGFAATRGTEPSRKAYSFLASQGTNCVSCGAWRGSYGQEREFSLYIAHTVEILRELRRVLRSSGVLFWNIGDSYEKNKSLALIPQRIAIAAQEDGWLVRDIIIWHKPNPMPSSTRDRLTNAYESILVLTKSKKYYWDAQAMTEPAKTKDGTRGGKRRMRNVWTMPVSSFRGAHFATFPEELPRRCVMAATEQGDFVLDPFGGSGTTGKVAMELARRSFLVDRNFGGDSGYQRLVQGRLEKFLCEWEKQEEISAPEFEGLVARWKEKGWLEEA